MRSSENVNEIKNGISYLFQQVKNRREREREKKRRAREKERERMSE